MQGPQEKSAGQLPLYLWGHEGEDKEPKHKHKPMSSSVRVAVTENAKVA